MRHDVCAAGELGTGELAPARIGEREIVVARAADGTLHALSGRCLHQGAGLAGGRLLADVEGERPGKYRLVQGREVIKCPWHGYEYELASGCALFDRRRRLRRYEVAEIGGRIVVEA
jgi:nitrite reductase/ring-hydroxylating ferredoxin subunit